MLNPLTCIPDYLIASSTRPVILRGRQIRTLHVSALRTTEITQHDHPVVALSLLLFGGKAAAARTLALGRIAEAMPLQLVLEISSEIFSRNTLIFSNYDSQNFTL